MTWNQHIQAAAESISLWGRKEGAATAGFFAIFLDIFQNTWHPLKWGVAPLFVETSLTPASHTPDLYVCVEAVL